MQPATEVEIIGRSSRGDKELHVNLSALDGTDFFTEEIFAALERNEADIAVHSLKDMSADHFFSHDAFAVVDRDDTRDVAIFNPGILDKIREGKTIVIGTCSPRREEMAVLFLKKALPQLHEEIKIETRSIRGNVESRLTQLHNGNYDATILATAGLNRLLRSEPDAAGIRELLDNKRLMLLPLIECVPAPCQGAIVAEAHPDNLQAVELLKSINEEHLFEDAYNEKKEAYQYGTGCLQRFGVTTIKTLHGKTLYAAGESNSGEIFSKWASLPEIDLGEKVIFSSTDYMKDFFSYEWNEEAIVIKQPVIFVANYKAVTNSSIALQQLNGASPLQLNKDSIAGKQKKIFASGTKTWFELAKQGFWVEGCADALGFEWFLPALQIPLLNIRREDICILTHEEAAARWGQKKYHALGNYKLITNQLNNIPGTIAGAEFIFWTSFSQYKSYGQFSKSTAAHACAGGETASLLKEQGIEPVIFPTIKSFEQWRKYSTRPISAG